ncbi:hypothetical protein E5288_WYG004698 [Bos mutus]|uniref:RNA-binding protein 25 n=1 Tax=Bos mutus TaxID=72004 RepID=A0A6B0RMS1_9CETA|nr:hypothetical protein [Bos mutus]
MSFPPHLNRPPMGIPALPPGIPPPQFPGFPPPVPPGTPMIPVPMSIMAPAPTVLVPTVSMVGKHLGARKDHPGLKAKENDENCGPTTTVFVGNISEKASDMLIRQLLAKCGLVLSWKRVQGASGKLQAFGFCEYKEPESTLRALRLLHDLQIGEKKLLVKVDAKTKAQLDEWKAKKKASNGIFRRFPVAPLIPYPLITKEDINAIEMEEDKRDLISREISKFRDTHKTVRVSAWQGASIYSTDESEERISSLIHEREKKSITGKIAFLKLAKMNKEKGVSRRKQQKKEREESSLFSQANEEDAYERRKLERKLREKEAAYQERLKNWEIRERKKTREYEKEAEREEERRREMAKEAKRLKEFLEDYDDDRDDPKYYSGNATPNTPGDESPCGIIIPHENSPDQQQPEEHRPKIGLSLKLGASNSPGQPNSVKRKKLPVDSVFNKFEDEDSDDVPRKRKLVPLDYGEDDKNAAKGTVNTEEKRKHIKSLIEKIPTAKPELFAYPLDWSIVDSILMERRIRPWINKKIIEYIGEEEATLVDFVCSKVMAHSSPQSILDDVAMVLDEEAEVFIVKMWRLLIYETEAKKIGLVK